jgi:hypothetical protein
MQWWVDWAKRHPFWSQITLTGALLWFVKQLGIDALFGSINSWIATQLAKVSEVHMDSLIHVASFLTALTVAGIAAVAVFQVGRYSVAAPAQKVPAKMSIP